MIKFCEIVSSATPNCFKFINQCTVKVIGLFVPGVSGYILSKADVILAINKFLADIHHFSDKPVRGEGLNFKVFKMHDLVPYLYTLINLYITVSATSYDYLHFLPELKLTRFCHLPFDYEIVEVPKPVLSVEVAKLRDNVRGSYRYLSYVDSYFYCSESLDNLLDDIRSCESSLFDRYDVRLQCVN